MTGLEIENFYKLDTKEYILENNEEFLKLYNDSKKNNCCILELQQIQNMIDEIVSFFEFKYHDKMIFEMIYCTNNNKNFYQSKKISKMLEIEELKYRLYHDYVLFLECEYPRYLEIRYNKWNSEYYMNLELIRLEPNGNIKNYDIDSLKKINGFEGIGEEESVESLLDYINNLINIPNNVDLTAIEKIYKYHQNQIVLRNKVLELTQLAILYSKNTLPIYGAIRVKSFVRMFNKEYNLKMNTNKIDEIMAIDYKDTEKINELVNERSKNKKNSPLKARFLVDRKKFQI